MKIVKLTAENVKRLRAVEITPDGVVQVVTGRNAQGKTSVLDAIWYALGGGKASRETAMPIRAGEDRARVSLDLGDLRVVRTWTAAGSTLTVTNADGAKYPTPQGVLDALVGRLSFDPLEFCRLSPRDQRDALLALVNIDEDLAELDRLKAEAYAERTDVGRRGKALGEVPPLHPDTPDEEVSVGSLMGRVMDAQAQARQIDDEMKELAKRQSQVEYWQQQLVEAQAGLDRAAMQYATQSDRVKGLPEYPNLSDLERELGSVDATNRRVQENRARRQDAADLTALHAEYDALSARIAAMDQAKATLLSEAAFPVEGLGFDESGVTFNGVPFSQASSAEQIRVSLAMAMALNPKLRVIRILDGSLLDTESMQTIASMAAENDFQVWIERVEDDSASAIVIEDGAVR